jgi:hypothetical protein
MRSPGTSYYSLLPAFFTEEAGILPVLQNLQHCGNRTKSKRGSALTHVSALLHSLLVSYKQDKEHKNVPEKTHAPPPKTSFSKEVFVVLVGSLLFRLLPNLQNTGIHPTLVPTYLHSINCSSITYIGEVILWDFLVENLNFRLFWFCLSS